MKPGLIFCVLLSFVTVFMWFGPNQPQAGDVTMPLGKINSVSYAPYEASQSPLTKSYATSAEVTKDLALIATQANGIRTYGSTDGDYDIGALAKQAGLKVWIGIWLGSDTKKNAAEMAAGIAEANAHPDVVTRVVVGNEVLLRRDLSVDDLIADIDYVHARVKQPVAYADVTDFWQQFPQVASHVDVVMIHILPYWEDKPLSLDASLGAIQSTTEQFKKLFPGKEISIGEAGWPSAGRWRGPAAPSRVNEAVFLRNFVALANREGVDYNVIEAFDQNWKYEDEGIAGANWGIWNANRELKFPLNGPVTERPYWRWYAALAVIAGWGLFFATGGRDTRVGVPAFMLGNGFAVACIGTLPFLYDKWLYLDALVNLPLQAIFAVFIIRRTAAKLAGEALPPVMTGAAVIASLRRFRLPLNYDGLTFIFIVSAAIFEAMLVFDGRYRAAPLPVFIIPMIGAVLRFWTKDKPTQMGWEELLAGFSLAILAIVDMVMEGKDNLEFIVWSIAAIALAAPIVKAAEGKKKRRVARR